MKYEWGQNNKKSRIQFLRPGRKNEQIFLRFLIILSEIFKEIDIFRIMWRNKERRGRERSYHCSIILFLIRQSVWLRSEGVKSNCDPSKYNTK